MNIFIKKILGTSIALFTVFIFTTIVYAEDTPSIKVNFPNGGEELIVGGMYWHDISVYSTKIGTVCASLVKSPVVGATPEPHTLDCAGGFNPANFHFTGGGADINPNNFVAPGKYYVMSTWISDDGTENLTDFSDAPFNVFSNSTKVLPYISISPGESYHGTVVSPNTSNVRIGSFDIRNKDGFDSVHVRALTVEVPLNVYSNISNIKVMYNGTLLASSNGVPNFSTTVFPVTFSIPEGVNANTIDVYADIGNLFANFSTKITLGGILEEVASSSTLSSQQGQTIVVQPNNNIKQENFLPQNNTIEQKQQKDSINNNTDVQKITSTENKANIITKQLKVGSKGDDVVVLQKFLIEKGFLIIPKNIPTGVYGASTKSAVIKFQKKNKIGSDGVVGSKTFKILNAQIIENNN